VGGSQNGSVVRWSGGTQSALRELPAGASRTVRFSLLPNIAGVSDRTPQVNIAVTVAGQRVPNDPVPQPFSLANGLTVRVESRPGLSAQALYSAGPFRNIGTVPPVAGSVTQYTVMFAADNGTTALADTVVEATLPAGVAWLDLKQASA